MSEKSLMLLNFNIYTGVSAKKERKHPCGLNSLCKPCTDLLQCFISQQQLLSELHGRSGHRPLSLLSLFDSTKKEKKKKTTQSLTNEEIFSFLQCTSPTFTLGVYLVKY